MNTKMLFKRAVRKLPPPRDDAAVRFLRAGRDLLLGREAPKPKRSPAQAAAPAPAPAAPAIPPPLPGVKVWARPGSYLSPIVDTTEITGRGSDIDEMVPLPGIDLDIDGHAAVWRSWRPHLQRWVDGEPNSRRRYTTEGNRMFGPLSAHMLAGAIGAMNPRRYIEIGSGFSSAVLLDINDEWRPADPIDLTFIEPHPARLESILREGDRAACTIIPEKVQQVSLDVFDKLEPGDVLFIDSTHIAKTESDVLRELFEILPHLPAGVNVHFHDIPYPFEYPMHWVLEQNRSWNEAYFLRSFLMYNPRFKVHFWTDYFARFGADTVSTESFTPLDGKRPTSMWITKVD